MIKSDTFEATSDPLDILSFRASNITGTRELPLEVRRNSTVADVTSSIADLMALPDDVAWSLRADRGQFLDEEATIGDLLEPGSHVTITPRTHLG
ncbi:MAG: hypothetical protein V3T22_01005 [Planctomycetota bacterium]